VNAYAARTSDLPWADWLTDTLASSMVLTVVVLAAAFGLACLHAKSKRRDEDG